MYSSIVDVCGILLALYLYCHMLKDQIKQGALLQIPSGLALHRTLPTNQTTVMPSLQDYQLLSPPSIFLVSSEVENNVLLVIPSQRNLHHPNVKTPLLHVKHYIPSLLVIILLVKLDVQLT